MWTLFWWILLLVLLVALVALYGYHTMRERQFAMDQSRWQAKQDTQLQELQPWQLEWAKAASAGSAALDPATCSATCTNSPPKPSGGASLRGWTETMEVSEESEHSQDDDDGSLPDLEEYVEDACHHTDQAVGGDEDTMQDDGADDGANDDAWPVQSGTGTPPPPMVVREQGQTELDDAAEPSTRNVYIRPDAPDARFVYVHRQPPSTHAVVSDDDTDCDRDCTFAPAATPCADMTNTETEQEEERYTEDMADTIAYLNDVDRDDQESAMDISDEIPVTYEDAPDATTASEWDNIVQKWQDADLSAPEFLLSTEPDEATPVDAKEEGEMPVAMESAPAPEVAPSAEFVHAISEVHAYHDDDAVSVSEVSACTLETGLSSGHGGGADRVTKSKLLKLRNSELRERIRHLQLVSDAEMAGMKKSQLVNVLLRHSAEEEVAATNDTNA